MSFVVDAFKAVGKAVTSVVKGVVKAITGVVKAVVNVATSIINFIAQPFLGLLGGMPGIPDAASEAQRQQGVLVQTQGANINVPVVYGYRKLGGTVVFAETGSTNNRYLYVAYVFCEGVVEGLREVFIDDWQLPGALTANLNAGQVVDVNADRYNGRVRLQWFPGIFFYYSDELLVGDVVKQGIFAEAPSFTNEMDFNGLAVLFARFEWKEIKTQDDADNNPFSGNIPQVQVSLLGRRVASLLTDETEKLPYIYNFARYSTNPAECLLDYLRNFRYGKGLQNYDIDWDSWKRAARKCNQTVSYLEGNDSISGPILTMNHVVDTGQSIMSNVKTMLMGFRAYMPFVQGTFKLRIEDAGNEYDILSGSAVIYQTFTKDDIIGPVTYTGIEKSNKYNVVAISYVDPDQKFSVQQVIYPETEEERLIYLRQDGFRENKLEATFPTLTNYAMAKDMARLLFNKSRRQETCSLTVNSKGLELEPGDNIRIQANILDFGDLPWRVVSIKINDNMTVDLGCVLNPDDIYPHVRVGEEDIVLPPYVPKGSTIYFPSSENRAPLGLVPPLNAVYPSDFGGSGTHPPPTDKNAPGGGGVGGGTPPGDEGPGPLPPQGEPPVPPIAPPPEDNQGPPPDPPPPTDFSAVLALRTAQLVDNRDFTYTFNITFTQPNDGQYQYTLIWVRPNRYSPWKEYRVDSLPGPGNEIAWTFGPSAEGIYEAYSRAYASDGRASNKVLYFQMSSRGDSRAQGRTITANQSREVTEGWTLPTPEVAVANNYDDNIDFFELRPRLSGGNPLDPRRLSGTIQQISNTLSTPVNNLITGFRIYYRLASATYWNYEDVLFPANYVAGQRVNFNLNGDFGISHYPASWTTVDPNSAIYANQTYRFLVRLLYADKTPAKKQLKPGNGRVEYSGGLFDFLTYGTVGNAIYSEAIPVDFTLLTIDQDPNKGYQEGLSVLPNIASIVPSSKSNLITINSNLPKDNSGNFFSKFLGNRIRFRKIVAGTNPPFVELDTGRIASNANVIITNITSGWEYGSKYQFVITSVFRDSSGEYEATDSLVADNVTISSAAWQFKTNVYDEFNFQRKNTKAALGQLRVAFDDLPTINAISWVRKQVEKTNLYVGNREVSILGNNAYLNNYFKLTFQPPSTSDHLIIYRREFNSTGAARSSTNGGFARYWLLGPWEKVRVSISSLTTNSDGFKVINVRGPIDYTYFDPYFQVISGRPLVDSKYGLSNSYPSANPPNIPAMFPYRRLGNNEATVTTIRRSEFIFVLEESSTEAPNGLYLRDFYTEDSGTDFKTEVEGFGANGVQRDVVVTVDNYNTFPSTYQRNINQAVRWVEDNNIALGQLHAVELRNVPRITTANALFPDVLQRPINNDIVY